MSEIKELYESIDTDLTTDLLKTLHDFKYINPENKPDPFTRSYRAEGKSFTDFIKPELRDYSAPMSIYLADWDMYYSYTLLHGVRKNKKGAKYDTTRERKHHISRLSQALGRKPTGEDFKKAFELPEKFDEICRIVDEDIKNLT